MQKNRFLKLCEFLTLLHVKCRKELGVEPLLQVQ